MKKCKHKYAWWYNIKADCDFYLCEKCKEESHRYDCMCGAYGNERIQMMSAKELKGRSYMEAKKALDK